MGAVNQTNPRAGTTAKRPSAGSAPPPVAPAMPSRGSAQGYTGLSGGTSGGITQNVIGSDYSVYTPGVLANTGSGRFQQQIDQNVANINQRPVLQMTGAQIDQAQQAQFRDQQMALANALQLQANGQGPSVAGSQLRQSTEMNLQAALAQAASARGGNLGAAQYQLGNARANIQQQAAMQLAQARIQEQMAARAQLGEVLGQGRGQDLGLASQQAGLNQQTAAVNLGSAQEQQAQADALRAQYIAMGMSAQQADYLARVQQQQFIAGQLNAGVAAQHGVALQQNAQNIQLAGGIAGGVGSVLGGIAGSMAGPGGTAAGAAAGGAAGNAIGRGVASGQWV